MINESDRVLAQTSGLPVTWCKMLGMQQHVSYISHLFLYKKDSSVTLSLRRCQRKHFPLTCGKLRVIQTTRISWMISKACQLMPAGMFFLGKAASISQEQEAGRGYSHWQAPRPEEHSVGIQRVSAVSRQMAGSRAACTVSLKRRSAAIPAANLCH